MAALHLLIEGASVLLQGQDVALHCISTQVIDVHRSLQEDLDLTIFDDNAWHDKRSRVSGERKGGGGEDATCKT